MNFTAVWDRPTASPTSRSEPPAATASRITSSRIAVHSRTFTPALTSWSRNFASSVMGGNVVSSSGIGVPRRCVRLGQLGDELGPLVVVERQGGERPALRVHEADRDPQVIVADRTDGADVDR